jgi:hypothetical protein
VLHDQNGAHTAHEDKASAIHRYYSDLLGTPPPRLHTLNWNTLRPRQRHDLSALDVAITTKEIEAAVRQTAPEKAPGPTGLSALFINHAGASSRMTSLPQPEKFSTSKPGAGIC